MDLKLTENEIYDAFYNGGGSRDVADTATAKAVWGIVKWMCENAALEGDGLQTHLEGFLIHTARIEKPGVANGQS